MSELRSHELNCAQRVNAECTCGAFEHNARIYGEAPKLTSTQYMAIGGVRCPQCESDQIQGDSIDFEGRHVYQNVQCLTCRAMWTDVYQLYGYSDLTPYDEPESVRASQETSA